jgi:hypothetical protein
MVYFRNYGIGATCTVAVTRGRGPGAPETIAKLDKVNC